MVFKIKNTFLPANYLKQIMDSGIYYKQVKPDESLSDFVESFWVLRNESEHDKKTVGLPDGRIDLFFIQPDNETFKVVLLGLGTQYHAQGLIPAKSLRFAVSFKLLAVLIRIN